MSAQEVPNSRQEQVEAEGGATDGSSPGVTSASIPTQSSVSVKKEPGTIGTSNGKDPAEICVVIGGSGGERGGGGGGGGSGARNSQTQGSYVCGVCGKKYKYYNCFQTHVRAHKESDTMAGEGTPPPTNNSFRYSCDICGKKYKYYSCFQEHRDLHAVDDPYEHAALSTDDIKEEEPIEPFQKIGPKTGSYVCEYCGKQYKYFNPYQEHVALHTPMAPKSFDMKSPRLQQRMNMDSSKYALPQTDGPFSRKIESTAQTSLVDTSSSQNSSGTPSPLVAASFPASQKPFTCGACGIQFQFYNNLLEHMQSHAADNENHSKGDSVKTSPGPAVQDQPWKSPQAHGQPQAQVQCQGPAKAHGQPLAQVQAPAPAQAHSQPHGQVQVHVQVQPHAPPPQGALRNHAPNQNNGLPEKERQQVAERLLRVMCSDLNMLNVLNSKDFLKLAQTLVDSGARHGPYSTRDALGNMSALALRQLPRMYNQVKVKVTCALGSNASLGIAVTCHSQTLGPESCYILTAYQVEGQRLKRYVLGVRECELREGPEQVNHWVQNVLSEFVMSDIRTVYVTEPRVWAAGVGGSPPGGGVRGRVCLRCAGCSLGTVVQAVLGKRSLQARGLHELAELLATCRDIAASTSLALREEPAPNSAEEGSTAGGSVAGQCPTPPCWDRTAEALLQVHAHFEQICEAYGRSKATAPVLQGLNKHLLGTLACLLAPLRLAALELSRQRRPTLQQVLPVYLRLEKLFTSKAGEAGAGTASKLCHYFLEALKENFKVERAHQVAMVLDPQLKLRSVPTYQHDEIIARVCEMATETRDGGASAAGGGGGGGGGGSSGGEERDGDGSPMLKRCRLDSGGGAAGGAGGNPCGPTSSSCAMSANEECQSKVRQEMFQYLGEPGLQGTPDLFQYWSSAVGERFPRLARLALWLLAVPAVGVRSDCISMCEQSLAMKRRQQVTADEMNKLIFLRSNMG